MRVTPAIVSVLFLLSAAPTHALEDGAEAERPRIGLVLSGGGARGAAHAGILKVLEEHRVPVDFIAGTSFGALVGGFYASGMAPNEIIEWIETLDWQIAAGDRPPRRSLSFRRKQDDYTYALRLQVGYRDGRFVLPKGAIGAHELGFLLRTEMLHAARWRHFDEMPIPFRAVATNIERGEAVVLEAGSLPDALLASMAVPGVVAPIEIEGMLLLDGGLTENLPVRVVREMGADIVIAVDIGTPLAGRDELTDLIGVTTQVIYMLGKESVDAAIASLGYDDILIRPDVSGIAAGDFASMKKAVDRGFASGPVVSSRLSALALDEAGWNAWLARHRSVARERPRIDFIEIDNPTTIDDVLIRARISQPVGAPLSDTALRRDIDALYSIGEFERVDFHVIERDGLTGLLITVAAKDLGPRFFRFGLNIQDDLGGDSAYNLLVLSNRTQVNRLNAEWRTELQIGETRRAATELFQPLTMRGDWFVQPRAEWLATRFDVFADGSRIARYELKQDTVVVEGGWQWRNIGQVAVGAFSSGVDARPRIGAPGLARVDERVGGWQWRLTIDQLDNWSFPADAWYLDLAGREASEVLGGVRDYGWASLFVVRAWSIDTADRVLLSMRAGGRTAGDLPIYEQFSLGGFLSLSGLAQGAVRGDYLFQARAIWYRRLFSLPTALGEGFYAGLSHERGNAWDERGSMRLGDLRWGTAAFVGADLLFGALYLGAGRADNGDMSGYLFLQRSFQ